MPHSLIATCRAAQSLGLNRGTSGNMSLRVNDGMLITPSAIACSQMTTADLVFVDGAGDAHGPGRPSSEWLFHHALYNARPEFHAIVHLHSKAATALACLHKGIPPFHYMVAVAGGSDIRCTPYALFGTAQLANYVVAGMQDRSACLLANHGLIAAGATAQRALNLAVEVEALAEQYLLALSAGTPLLLNERQMQEVLSKFVAYRLGERSA